jgi:poly-gamma-glutamate synthesis protein (capsule biosynthesis protein)
VEEYNEGVIVYSMGNFVFDMWQRKMRESIIFSCSLSKGRIKNFEMFPVIIDKYFRPHLMNGIEKEKLMTQITSDFLEVRDNNMYLREVRACRQSYHFDLAKHLVQNVYRYNYLYLYQIISKYFKKQR